MKKTVSVSALIVAFSAVTGLAVLSTACGDDDDNPAPTGSSTSSGGASSSGQSSSGQSSSGESSSGAVSQANRIKAVCALLKKCQPAFYAAAYTDDAACEADKTSSTSSSTTTYPGTATPTQAQVDACTAKLTGASCAESLTAALSPECQFAGTGANDAACNFSTQCSGGLCKKAAAADDCGKCADTGKEGDTCDPANPSCGAGLYCNSTDKKCAKPKAHDTPCGTGDVCEVGTQCYGGKCQIPKEIGESCTLTGNECRLGLQCAQPDNKCAEAKYAKVGEKCGLDGATLIQCANATCVGTTDKKCAALAKEGEDCEALGTTNAKPACGTGLTCTGGKCVKAAEPTVCK